MSRRTRWYVVRYTIAGKSQTKTVDAVGVVDAYRFVLAMHPDATIDDVKLQKGQAGV